MKPLFKEEMNEQQLNNYEIHKQIMRSLWDDKEKKNKIKQQMELRKSVIEGLMLTTDQTDFKNQKTEDLFKQLKEVVPVCTLEVIDILKFIKKHPDFNIVVNLDEQELKIISNDVFSCYYRNTNYIIEELSKHISIDVQS